MYHCAMLNIKKNNLIDGEKGNKSFEKGTFDFDICLINQIKCIIHEVKLLKKYPRILNETQIFFCQQKYAR